jgi:hypothetical protein
MGRTPEHKTYDLEGGQVAFICTAPGATRSQQMVGGGWSGISAHAWVGLQSGHGPGSLRRMRWRGNGSSKYRTALVTSSCQVVLNMLFSLLCYFPEIGREGKNIHSSILRGQTELQYPKPQRRFGQGDQFSLWKLTLDLLNDAWLYDLGHRESTLWLSNECSTFHGAYWHSR